MDPCHYNPDSTSDLRWHTGLDRSDNLNMTNNAPSLVKELEREFALKVDSSPQIESSTVVNLLQYDLT